MEGFIVRTTAYHGEPRLVGRLPTRSNVSFDEVVESTQAINRFDRVEAPIDLSVTDGKPPEPYAVEDLIDDFEDEYGCKVNFGPEIDVDVDGNRCFVFDVFEPSWSTQGEAEDVVCDLRDRLRDWIQGYPTGR